MRVRAIAECPTEEQSRVLAATKLYLPGKQTFGVTVGKEYVVFGMHISRGLPWIWILVDPVFNTLLSVPIILFEIVDDRVSRFWKVRHWPDGDVTFWPLSFYRDFYVDDLIENVPAIVEDFRRLRRVIEAESDFDFM